MLDRSAAAAKSVGRGYKENFQQIYDRLKARLKPDMNVFTHNPWGEYGHEEHIQMFRVLQKLREEIGFRLWMSNYCTDRAAPLAMRYFVKCPGGYVRQETDKAFASRVADHLQEASLLELGRRLGLVRRRVLHGSAARRQRGGAAPPPLPAQLLHHRRHRARATGCPSR